MSTMQSLATSPAGWVISDRARLMRRAQDSYDGRPSKPLLVRPGETDDNLLISLGGLLVDKGVSFLFGEDVPSQVPGAKAAAKQDWLDECWRRNKRALTLQKLATNGAICGHSFARLIADKPFPRVVILDPQTVEVTTDPDDIDSVWRYTITPPAEPAEDGAEETRRRTVIQNEHGEAGQRLQLDHPETWTIIDQVYQGGAWVNVATATWPYPFAPIVDCQNMPRPNDYWGKPDLGDDVLHVLAAINRVASHYNKIIRIHAHPKVYTVGMGARNLDTSIDAVIQLPSETADLRALEMKSDLASTKALLDTLLNLLSMMVRIPLVAMGMPDNLGAISGVALQIRYQPLIEKTKLKRRTYGDAVQELDRRLLALGGFDDTTVTTLQWPDIMPSDPLEERQVAVLDDSLGVASKHTLAEQFNYDYEAEQTLIAEEKRAAMQQAQELAALMPQPTQPQQPGQPGQTAGPSPVAAPAGDPVPPPAALGAPLPDIAKTAKSR